MDSPAGAVPEWTLGDRLDKAQRVSGLTDAELMEALGVGHRNTLGNWKSGRSKPSRANVLVWAMATGVDFDWLWTGLQDDLSENVRRTQERERVQPVRNPAQGTVTPPRSRSREDAPDNSGHI